MSSLKKALKAAKTALDGKDAQTAHEHIVLVLDSDPNNYFGHIFQAKYCELIGDIRGVETAFRQATEIDPKNPLAWKGFYQFALKGKDFGLYFEVVLNYIALQYELELPVYETINDFHRYLVENNYRENKALRELYLSNIIPGMSPLGDLIGTERIFGGVSKNVQEAIGFFSRKEDEEVKALVGKERMKYSSTLTATQQNALLQKCWALRQHLKLPQLYDLFLSTTEDDELRAKYESKLLQYKLELLKIHHTEEAIAAFKETVDDMVLVRSKNIQCWHLYWDLSDVAELADLDVANLTYFLTEHPQDPLARVLLAYLMSDICAIEDKETILKNIHGSNKLETESPEVEELDGLDEEKLESLKQDQDTSTYQKVTYSQEEILDLMQQSYKETNDNVLVQRIFITYLLHIREYEDAFTICKNAIKILADKQRNYGLGFVHGKIDILCSQAIVYTYYEAPKNYPRALQLYGRVLQDDPSNTRAKVGRATILLEKNDFINAQSLLLEVLQFQPDSVEAMSELGWCQVMLEDYEQGRSNLVKALKTVQGSTVRSFEVRSSLECRLAKSYLKQDGSNSEFVKHAYDHLIQALKDSKNNANAYTNLGFIYKDAYNDQARASKCFYKAFELDVIEVAAAKCLVADCTNKNQWDVAEIICKRIVESERSRRFLFSVNYDDEDKSWPYRVLGSSALNKQDDASAIEWFQTALRMTAMDLECWIGLGEAYASCGRLDAACKVFQFALEKSPDSWIIKYMLGKVQCDMHEYDEGQSMLYEALELAPKENVVLAAIYESLLASSKFLVEGNFFGRATEDIVTAIEYIYQSVQIDSKSQMLWKTLSDCLRIFLVIQERLNNVPLKTLQQIFSVYGSILDGLESEKEFIEEVTGIDNITKFTIEDSQESVRDIVLEALVLSSKIGVASLPMRKNNSMRAAAYYNLGLAYFEVYQFKEHIKDRDLALKCFKKAIQLEANNADFWVALGNTYFGFNPLVAQHCFIKATVLETRDASVWCNLATLYLKYGDIALAKETFLRAQSVAPLEATAWLGQALASEAANTPEEAAVASRQFIHGYVVSNGRSHLAQLLYALCIINKRLGSNGSATVSDVHDVETAQEFSIANFAMNSYFKFRPDDVVALKIALSISERCKDYRNAIATGERLFGLLEKEYDVSGKESVALEIAAIRAQLARVYLGNEDYENAIECAQFSMDIIESLQTDSGSDSTATATASVLSARIVIGLSLFFDGQYDEALAQLQEILTSHGESRTLVCLTAQLLNALGTEDTKQAALEQLFAYIEAHGSSLLVVLMLGCIALVDDIAEYFEAIKDELQGLLLEELQRDKRKRIPHLLCQINERMGRQNAKDIWQRNALLFPSDYSVWTQLNDRMALTVASLRDSKLPAPRLAGLYKKIGDVRSVQRSLVLFPADVGVRKAFQAEVGV